MLRFGHLVGDAPLLAVTAQAAAAIAAGVLLLRIGRELAGPAAGLVSAAMLLVNPMTSQWVRFVLTETLFYALAVAITVVGVRVLTVRSEPDLRRYSVTLAVLAFLAITFRPTGPLLAGAAVCMLVLARLSAPAARTLWLGAIVAATSGLMFLGASVVTPAEGTLSSQLRAGVVVEGTAEVRTVLPMPDGPEGVVSYLLEHPLAVARLVTTRIGIEVSQVRRHYPAVVNAVLGSTMLGIAALATLGLRDPRGHAVRVPTGLVLVPLVAVVGVTFAVPEGRYGWAGLVALAPAVGVGAAAALERLGGPQPGRSSGGTAR